MYIKASVTKVEPGTSMLRIGFEFSSRAGGDNEVWLPQAQSIAEVFNSAKRGSTIEIDTAPLSHTDVNRVKIDGKIVYEGKRGGVLNKYWGV